MSSLLALAARRHLAHFGVVPHENNLGAKSPMKVPIEGSSLQVPLVPISQHPPSFALLLGFAWLLAALQFVIIGWPSTALRLPDPDDAMRLVDVREFLAGKGWFDQHVTRVFPPIGYDNHWSRLIDAGLAGLILAFRTVLAPDQAERLAIVLWPILWLLPTIGAVGAIAWRLAGYNAALIALVPATFSLSPIFQAGRIDHHNVQLALALLTIAASIWADRWRPGAWVTGLLTGLALAIGLESAPFIMLAGAGFALRFALDRKAARDLRSYGLTAAMSAVVAFLVSVAPSQWTHSACDAIAINSTMAVVVGGLGLAAAGQLCHSDDWRRRALVLFGVAFVASTVFFWFEPRCLGGTFAMIDPAIKPVWLDYVADLKSLRQIMAESPVNALSALASAAVPLLALLMLAPGRRDPGFLIAAAALLLAFAMMFKLARMGSYVNWLGLPFLAAVLTRVRWIVPRILAALVLSPVVVTICVHGIGAAARPHSVSPTTPDLRACMSKDGAAALAKLPPGLILTNQPGWGPYLLAFTPHSVFAAPYHRSSSMILTAHEALTQTPAEAQRIIADNRVDYIAFCGPNGPLGVKGEALQASLWGQLRANHVPGWLEPVPIAGPFTVYHVRR